MKMERKQNKYKQKSSKHSEVGIEENLMSKYTNEEISCAETLTSIKSNESFDQSVSQLTDVIDSIDTSGDNKDNETSVNIKYNSSDVKESEPTVKSKIDESVKNAQMNDSEPKPNFNHYKAFVTNSSQPSMYPNYYGNYSGNYYGYYPMDPYGYPQHPYYGMHSMAPNIPAMSPRQCPYCSMITPAIPSFPGHSPNPMPNKMTSEAAKGLGVNPFAVIHPQMTSTPIPSTSLYPYYQNGPKVTSACVSSAEPQKN